MNRDNKGRFARSGIIGQIVSFIVVIVICASIFAWYSKTHPNIETKTVTIDSSDIRFASRINDLEKSVVEQVRTCEKGKFTEQDGLVTYDPKLGGKNDDKAMSYGTLQFKKATVIYYEKKLFNRTFTGKDAILLALDDTQSGELAQAIMFNSPNLANDWANCEKSLSVNAMILAIKKIE